MHTRLDKLDIEDFDLQFSHEKKYLIYAPAGEKQGVRILRAKEIIRLMMTMPVEKDGFRDF